MRAMLAPALDAQSQLATLCAMTVDLASIQAARTRIRPFIYHSPCPASLSLSRLCGMQIFCKLDHLQMTGSFKERGARNRLMLLTDEQRRRGVIAASAGNHALGLAYHGQLLDVPVTVVMPTWAPLIKVANCRGFGATVIQHGADFAAARERALALALTSGAVFVPPYDDADVISGQGTLGLEILEDVPDLDAVIVPVGGGGLISGIGTALKALKPSVQVIGVEAAAAPTLDAAFAAGHPVAITPTPTLADGLAVSQLGTICFDIAKRVVDRVVLVDEAQLATAIIRLMAMEKTVVEGAGAAALAAAMHHDLGLAGKKVVLLLCGGNIDLTTVGRIIDRGLAADGRLCRIVARINERPGSLAALLEVFARSNASVQEVFHDRHFGPGDVARVTVTIVAETRDAAHIVQLRSELTAAGIELV